MIEIRCGDDEIRPSHWLREQRSFEQVILLSDQHYTRNKISLKYPNFFVLKRSCGQRTIQLYQNNNIILKNSIKN